MRQILTCAPSLEQRQSFPELLERLFIQKHTGPVVVHFAGGVAKSVEIQQQSERIQLEAR